MRFGDGERFGSAGENVVQDVVGLLEVRNLPPYVPEQPAAGLSVDVLKLACQGCLHTQQIDVRNTEYCVDH